jgi:galactose mutarotase-like enzyme
MELTAGKSRAVIAPERGALVKSWVVNGEELLYLDEDTFRDPSKNVRGGNPVLFPSPGKLDGDRYPRGAMKQHGFARNLPWRVAGENRLVLEATDATRAQYPWDFRVELSFSLTETTLRIEQRVENQSGEAMRFGFGFHPYFAVPLDEKRATTVETSATRAWDNVHKKVIDLHGIDLAHGEVDIHLLDHNCTSSAVKFFRTIRIEASEDYRRWVVWTLPGKPFVCVEPWTSPGNALNTGEGVIELARGAEWSGYVEYSVTTNP